MNAGRVKFFDPVRGFGFIAGDDGADTFVHVRQCEKGLLSLKPGDRVVYTVLAKAGGRTAAQDVKLEPKTYVVPA